MSVFGGAVLRRGAGLVPDGVLTNRRIRSPAKDDFQMYPERSHSGQAHPGSADADSIGCLEEGDGLKSPSHKRGSRLLPMLTSSEFSEWTNLRGFAKKRGEV